MKTLKLILLLLLSIHIITYSQSFEYDFKLIIEDSIRSDSVIYGYKDSSTISIDTLLGETNIYNLPFDSFEIRAVQRDNSSLCTYTNSSLNIDSKIDYRNWDYNEDPNKYFQFIIKSKFYPFNIYAVFPWVVFNYDNLLILDTVCNEIHHFFPDIGKTLIKTINDTNTYYIKVYFDMHWEIEESNYKEILCYPNPSQGVFNFTKPQDIVDIQVFNAYGQQIMFCVKQDRISLVDHPAGMYFVRMKLLNGEIITSRLLKE